MTLSQINRRKFPHLYRATERGLALVGKARKGWERVIELRKHGGGDRLVRQLLGVKSEPMPEDVKARLRGRREERP